MIGRDQHMSAAEHDRLRWRHEHVIVNSRRVVCITYDELLGDLSYRLDWYGPAIHAGG